jgi:hypothetical protein
MPNYRVVDYPDPAYRHRRDMVQQMMALADDKLGE